MADAYLDHGAYSSQLGSVPTWGVPQEGDGASKDPAASAAVASIVFTANVTAGNTVSVCGVSFTAVASGATGNQFNVGASLSASIDNLVAALNGTSPANASQTQVAAGVAMGLPQLRNLIFARNSGGTTLQVMMRVGSANLNGATNPNCRMTVSGWATSTALPVDFAGGTGGCWGWFANPTAIGVSSSMAARTYGILIALPMVCAAGFNFTEHDEVNVRTGRNTVINWGAADLLCYASRLNLNMLFDDGRIWTGDSPNAKLTFNITIDSGGQLSPAPGLRRTRLRCRSKYALEFGLTWTGTGTSTYTIDFRGGGGDSYGTSFERVAFIERNNAGRQVGINFDASGYAIHTGALVECLLDFRATPRTNLIVPLVTLRNGMRTIRGNTILYNLTGAGGLAFTVALCRHDWTSAFDLDVAGNVVDVGQPGELPLLSLATIPAVAGSWARGRNNKGIGLPVGSVGFLGSAGSINQNNATLILDNFEINGQSKYEDRRGYVQWQAGLPCLSTPSPDGSPWSWVVYWGSGSQVIYAASPFAVPETRLQMRLPDGPRTLSVEWLIDSAALVQLPKHAELEVNYVNASGAPVLERHPISFLASSSVWANTAGAPYNTWVPRKCSITTLQPVKQNSMLGFQVVMNRPAESAATFAVDPEVAVS